MNLREENYETEEILKQLIENGNTDQAVDYFHDSLIGYEYFLNFNIENDLKTEFLSEYANKFRAGDRQDFYDTIFRINLRASENDGRDIFYCCNDDTVKLNYAHRAITEWSLGQQVMENVVNYISGLNKEQIETFLPIIDMNPVLFFDKESDEPYFKDFWPVTYAILNNEDSLHHTLEILLERLSDNYTHHADHDTYEYNVFSYITEQAQAYEKVILKNANGFINVLKEKERYDGEILTTENNLYKVISQNIKILIDAKTISRENSGFTERVNMAAELSRF